MTITRDTGNNGGGEEVRELARKMARDCVVTQALGRYIEQLIQHIYETEIEPLRDVLKPLASAADKADSYAAESLRCGMGEVSDSASPGWGITYGHLKAARAAIAKATTPQEASGSTPGGEDIRTRSRD